MSSSWISTFFLPLFLLLALLPLVWTFTLQAVRGGKWKRLTNAEGKQSLSLPPGPPTLPILGNLHMLGVLPHQNLRKLAMIYGPFMHLRLGLVPTIVVSSPHFAELFLKTHDSFFASRPLTEAGTHMSYGSRGVAFSPYGPYWRSIRKWCMSELLGHAKVESLRPIRREALLGLVQSLRDVAEARDVVDLSALVGSLSAGVSCQIVLGSKYRDVTGVVEMVHEGNRLVGAFNVGDFIPHLRFLDLQGLRRRIKAIHRTLDDLFEKVIDERLREGGGGEEDRFGGKAFVDAMVSLMENQEVEVRVTRTSIKAVMLDMLAASVDTSSATIEWALSELLKHPRVMKKLQQELERAVGRDRMVEESDLRDLEYLDMVVKEALRLHPVAPLLVPHEAIEGSIINNFHVPKGSRIIINAWAIGRDPHVWKNAGEFHPERFAGLDVDVKGRHFQLIPFGSGRRGCPGMQMGLALVRLVLAQLVHCFDWELPNSMSPNELDMTVKFGLSMTRADHLLARPSFRLHHP